MKNLTLSPREWLYQQTLSHRFTLGAAMMFFLAIVFSTEILLHYRSREADSDRRTAALTHVSHLRARIDRELNAVLYLSSGLTSYLVVRHQHPNPAEIRDILATLHSNARHVRNFTIAVGYKVAYVYPLAGNEKALEIDFEKLPAQWPAVKLAIDSARGTLTGPVQLVQGGEAFIYRTPIFVGNRYWGLLSTVIDSPSFFAAAFEGFDQESYEFAIRSTSSQQSKDDAVWGNQALFSDPHADRLEMEIPNGKWLLAVRSTQDNSKYALRWGIRGLGWLVALLGSLGVAALLRQRSELARQAGFDSLTNLPNRRLFDDRLEQAMRRQSRNKSSQIGILFIDLDGFKEINDRHGHKIGDITLRTAALRIRDEIRISDTVARWGGDEFVAIIEETDSERLNQLIERLRNHIRKPFEADGLTLELAASFGAALYPGDAQSATDLLRQADQHMYEDKQRNKR